jgi:hypothetical protein
MKRWRYRLFATAGKLITRARRTRLLIPDKAPEASTITTILTAIAETKTRLRQRVPVLA